MIIISRIGDSFVVYLYFVRLCSNGNERIRFLYFSKVGVFKYNIEVSCRRIKVVLFI